MDNKKVTPNLIRRYISGKTNLEETVLILNACKTDVCLREYIDIAYKLYRDAMRAGNVNVDLTNDQFVFVPRAVAAECDRDNLCSLKCELFLLSNFYNKKDLSEDSLLSEARQLNILKDEGTPLYNMGRLMSIHGLSVIKQYGATVKDLQTAIIEQGCGVMVPIMGSKTFHAIAVLSIDGNKISFYNPATCSQETMSVRSFEKSWKKSNCYLVKTALKEEICKPNSSIYHPDINVPELTGRFKEIEWGLAEMFHDLWSSKRFKEGWKYDKMRDDNKKLHPDLRPLADLPLTEIGYDLTNAQAAVYLLTEVFGFELVSREEIELYCIKKLEELGYVVHKRDKNMS